MQINIQNANSYSDLSKEVNNFQCEFCNSNSNWYIEKSCHVLSNNSNNKDTESN